MSLNSTALNFSFPRSKATRVEIINNFTVNFLDIPKQNEKDNLISNDDLKLYFTYS